MEQYFNKKIRKHGNGLVEVRVYQKALSFGGVRKTNKSKISGYEYLDIPFLEEPVKSRKYLSGDGFTIAHERDALTMYKSVKRTKDKVFDYANALDWEWFVTFTFNAEKVDRYSYVDVSKKFSQWLNNARKRYAPDMQYVVVPERHKDGAYHFHGLFANCYGLGFVQAINQATMYKGKPNKYFGKPLERNGTPVFNMKKFTLGNTDCEMVKDTKKCANYILKYITKELIEDTPEKKRYWCSKNLPKVQEEHIFEFEDFEKIVENVLNDCIEKNPDTYSNLVELEHGDFSNKILYVKC